MRSLPWLDFLATHRPKVGKAPTVATQAHAGAACVADYCEKFGFGRGGRCAQARMPVLLGAFAERDLTRVVGQGAQARVPVLLRATSRGDVAEAAFAVVGEGLLDFFHGVHYEGAVAGYRLV